MPGMRCARAEGKAGSPLTNVKAQVKCGCLVDGNEAITVKLLHGKEHEGQGQNSGSKDYPQLPGCWVAECPDIHCWLHIARIHHDRCRKVLHAQTVQVGGQ